MSIEPEEQDQTAGAGFQRLVDLMRRLRAENGCAWDREQTLESLRPFVIEETYEVVDAIDRGDLDALRDELGDFLLEAVFLAQIAAERGDFDIGDSLRSICDKLVRRHPHVFGERAGDTRPLDAAEVKRRWEEIKADEQKTAGRPARALGSIPDSLPALLRAYRLGKRAATVGFDWPNAAGVEAKVAEELAELAEARAGGSAADVEEEIGDLLFTIANWARHLDVDPESALRAANRKFSERFAVLESRLETRGVALRDATLEEMEAEWERVKTAT
jgi:MazG family protein